MCLIKPTIDSNCDNILSSPCDRLQCYRNLRRGRPFDTKKHPQIVRERRYSCALDRFVVNQLKFRVEGALGSRESESWLVEIYSWFPDKHLFNLQLPPNGRTLATNLSRVVPEFLFDFYTQLGSVFDRLAAVHDSTDRQTDQANR